MLSHPSLRLIEASDAAQRLGVARTWVSARADGPGVLIVSASRGAADDLARSVAAARGGAIGFHRFSIAQLAARMAAPVLAARGIAPVSSVGAEAVAARATFEASRGEGLSYFGPVARTPGFPRALARTLQEIVLAGVDAAALASLPLGGPDLATLLERFEEQFAAASATSRAELFDAASDAPSLYRGLPLLLLDVPMESAVESAFVLRLIADGLRSARHRAIRRSLHARSPEGRGVDAGCARAAGRIGPHCTETLPLRHAAAARARRARRRAALLRTGRRPRMRGDRAPDPGRGTRRRAVRRHGRPRPGAA